MSNWSRSSRPDDRDIWVRRPAASATSSMEPMEPATSTRAASPFRCCRQRCTVVDPQNAKARGTEIDACRSPDRGSLGSSARNWHLMLRQGYVIPVG